jgi:hypothetical protein
MMPYLNASSASNSNHSTYQQSSTARSSRQRATNGYSPDRSKKSTSYSTLQKSAYSSPGRSDKKRPRGYKPYKLNDYKDMSRVESMGGLGPDLDSDQVRYEKNKAARRKEVAKKIRYQNKVKLMKEERIRKKKPKPKPQPKPISKSERAKQFAKQIRKPVKRSKKKTSSAKKKKTRDIAESDSGVSTNKKLLALLDRHHRNKARVSSIQHAMRR